MDKSRADEGDPTDTHFREDRGSTASLNLFANVVLYTLGGSASALRRLGRRVTWIGDTERFAGLEESESAERLDASVADASGGLESDRIGEKSGDCMSSVRWDAAGVEVVGWQVGEMGSVGRPDGGAESGVGIGSITGTLFGSSRMFVVVRGGSGVSGDVGGEGARLSLAAGFGLSAAEASGRPVGARAGTSLILAFRAGALDAPGFAGALAGADLTGFTGPG